MPKNTQSQSTVILKFNQGDAQKLVDAYRVSGKHIEALRLLQCMKDKALYDMDCFDDDISRPDFLFSCLPIVCFIEKEFIPNLDKQMEEIRGLLRAGI